MNMTSMLKVTAVWTTVVYAVCFLGVALMPGIRPLFMQYALHTNMSLGENVLTLGTFVSGLVIWNIVALLAVALYVFLYNFFRASA